MRRRQNDHRIACRGMTAGDDIADSGVGINQPAGRLIDRPDHLADRGLVSMAGTKVGANCGKRVGSQVEPGRAGEPVGRTNHFGRISPRDLE